MHLALEDLTAPGFSGLAARIGSAAEELQMKAYLIGGIVRDLLLIEENRRAAPDRARLSFPDVDIMLEGDALVFVGQLRNNWRRYFPQIPPPVKGAAFRRYKTAKLEFAEEILPGIGRLDFSTARSETYPVPGGRPDISAGDLKSDLARRDFSINAMAISLAPADFGELRDSFNGGGDLRERKIRVLHEQSFVDDPARLIRALRFVVRLRFALEEKTAQLFSQAVEARRLSTVPAFRVFDEFRKALNEEDVLRVVRELEQTKLLEQIHPRLRAGKEFLACFDEAKSRQCTSANPAGRARTGQWRTALPLLLAELSGGEYQELLRSFNVPAKEEKRLLEERQLHAH